MAKKWTLPNAVKKFKPHLKKSLNKNKGNLNTDVLASLIKEMKCYYEEVKVEGTGRDRIIFTDKKRKVKAKKEDKRQFNKGIAPPHSKHLALIVMSKMDDIENKARTRNGWATYFGLISPAEQAIMKGIYSEEALKPYKEFIIELGIIEDGEEEIFQDLAYTLKNVVRVHLQTVLDQAEELKLISIISSWNGKVKGSRVPIEIDKPIADKINSVEAELLKKHGIKKAYSLMFKNSRKTKAFKAEWLEYIENVEDEEGDVMRLQYIYEVFQIEVLNKNAFDDYINAHYPSEIDSFNLYENEQSYDSMLLDYVVQNAQKQHDKRLEFESKKLKMDEDTIEVLAMFNITEDEFIAQNQEMEMRKELTPYEALLKSDKYVDCIRNLHIQLHGMSTIDSERIKKVQQMKDKQNREELERFGLSNLAEVVNKTTVKNQIRNNDDSRLNAMEQQEEPTKREQSKHQINEPVKEIILENTLEKRVTTADESNIEPSNHYDEIMDDEYQATMGDIRNEIHEYEEKYGDKAMEYMRLDSVIRELTREVTAKESIAEFKQKLLSEKEMERKEWDKVFKGGQPVTWKQTSNNPLEVFYKIRGGRNDKENS
ncbi:hypothetical protein [Bacillus sp. 7884-1]|uniref:hypothetical protein n=1 Tax=Bacillus sp. 7884-1 TaxID=2021693 RepID=UPI000BA6C713|nr:hypothetical protein [Bacillus sp. 7884-1]PAE42791.1 hypothetical protein CHI06_09850 [Bacillus sp. 7884-1]